ncbi:type II secretion system protein GspL [Psychromonas sp. PT13]|uniref:type II secretion system protein GspL n=1 Tax=Psychromonas sp. PT13 TaxID=3439547 RepID=UPI003EB8A09B
MNERLIIRLASKASQKNHWLIWSDNEDEIIASGELENAEQLSLLTEKAQNRTVVCLVPCVDVPIREIPIKGSFNRQMQQALPYLVEDDLASDVELLHFNVIAKQTDLLHVAICEKKKITMWLSWLEDAEITCRQFIPEGLTLPVGEDGKWQAVQLGSQWIIRESQDIAWSCEQDMLALILSSKITDEEPVYIESFSAATDCQVGHWTELSPLLPIELLSKGVKNNKVNLLTGPFKPYKERNNLLEKWRLPAILCVGLFVLVLVNLSLKNARIEAQTEQVKARVESVYKQAFPEQSSLRYVRIKKKIQSMLVGLDGNADSNFLRMLNDLVPAFANSPKLQVSNIKFDDKNREMRISANADNFQSFEKFNEALAAQFEVEQGALSNSNGQVSGLLTIRMK